MSSEENCPKSWNLSKLFVLYDLSYTKEIERENATFYYRPHYPSKCSKTALCGQLAGAIQFCKSSFSPPSKIRTKQANLAFKYHSPFVLILGGPDAEWASNRLRDIFILLEASIGDLEVLWTNCGHSHSIFSARISPVLDDILRSIVPELINDSSPQESPCSMPSPSEGRKVRFECDSSDVESDQEKSGLYNFDDFNRELSAIPSISLPESGCEAFLKGEQILQVCEANGLAVTGATLYKSGILNGHADTSVWPLMTSLDSSISQGAKIFDEMKVDFKLPTGVSLRSVNIQKQAYLNISDNRPKSFAKRDAKKGLHQMQKPLTLSSLYSATKNSLHSYPSTISAIPSIPKHIPKREEVKKKVEEKEPSENNVLFNAAINKKSQQAILDQETLNRSCRSLPGTPRKIRVSTMLPDVGNDSPNLRYKVLTSRRPNPISSSHNTPMRKPPPLKSSSTGKENEVFNGLSHRGMNLCAPVLKRKELQNNNESFSNNSSVTGSLFQDSKNKNTMINSSDISEKKFNMKNAKNKLNLHFAPDTINRPSEDDSEFKIAQEINGSFYEKENFQFNESYNVNLYSPGAASISPMDEEERSESEESDISVLELSSLTNTQNNVDLLFEKATKMDSPLSESETEKETFYDSLETISPPKCTTDGKYVNVPVFHKKYEHTSLMLLLDSHCTINYEFICYLSLMTNSLLQDINAAVTRVLELSEPIVSDVFLQKSCQTLRGTEVSSLNPALVSTAHSNFSQFPNLMEMTLRCEKCVLWANRTNQSETFYQVEGKSRPGLPIPSDPIARIPYEARKRLERDHAITVL